MKIPDMNNKDSLTENVKKAKQAMAITHQALATANAEYRNAATEHRNAVIEFQQTQEILINYYRSKEEDSKA